LQVHILKKKSTQKKSTLFSECDCIHEIVLGH
jgi:hypothetical protein